MSETIRKAYKTDLSDEHWSLVQPLLPPPKKTGKKISVDLREVVNAILYWNRTGGDGIVVFLLGTVEFTKFPESI